MRSSRALTECREAVRLDESSEAARLALIGALRATDHDADALQAALEAVEKFQRNVPILTAAAELSFKQGDFSRSAELFETLIGLAPGEPGFFVNLSESYMRLERDSDAIAALRKALALDPAKPAAYLYLGKNYFDLGLNNEAVEALQKAAQLDPRSGAAWYYLAGAERNRGNFQKAIDALNKAVATSPNNPDYHYWLGSTYVEAARNAEAVAPLRNADRLRPGTLRYKTKLGLALMESGGFDEAIEVLSQAERLSPGDSTVDMFLRVSRGRKQGMAQIQQLKDQAEKDPKDTEVRTDLLNLYSSSGRMAEAEAVIAELLKISPNDGKIYNVVGVGRSNMGQLDKAAEAYARAVELFPHYVIYMSLANALQKLGRIEEALAACKKAFDLKSDSILVLKMYADILMDSGRRREALEMYKRAHGAEPTNSAVLYNLGLVSAMVGDMQAAKQYLELLKSMDPANAKLLARCIKLF